MFQDAHKICLHLVTDAHVNRQTEKARIGFISHGEILVTVASAGVQGMTMQRQVVNLQCVSGRSQMRKQLCFAFTVFLSGQLHRKQMPRAGVRSSHLQQL